jgi:Ca-activated chloride channel family protein
MPTLHVAYPYVLFTLLPIYACIAAYRWARKNSPVLRYSLADVIAYYRLTRSYTPLHVLRFLRTCSLLLLLFLISRPQWVDHRTNVRVNGVDIVLALDISGSMRLFDDLKDRRSRLDVAKEEAIHFVGKRTSDQIGVVIFAADALTICPLTLDTSMLKTTIGNLSLGDLNPNGTLLFTGLATAINRLKNSNAKSKAIVLLTDGQPEGETGLTADTVISMAQQFGIKIYTVAVGNEVGGFLSHPIFGTVPMGVQSTDKVLLAKIAGATGGKAFEARNPQQMREIYNTINALEKTTFENSILINNQK